MSQSIEKDNFSDFPLRKPTSKELETIGEPYGIRQVKGALRVDDAKQLQLGIARDIELPLRTIELSKYINRSRIALAECLELDGFRARQLAIAGSNIYASAIQSLTHCIVIPSHPDTLSQFSEPDPEMAVHNFSVAANQSGLLAISALIEPQYNLAGPGETTMLRAGIGIMHSAVTKCLSERRKLDVTAPDII